MVLGRLLVAAAAVTTAASGGGGSDSESCPAQESGALSGASKREYCIIGAGPGGLQMAAQLEGSLALGVVRSYTVFERAPAPASFFRRYPRHRTLLSPSKTQTGTANLEASLRHDRNSLLPFEPRPNRSRAAKPSDHGEYTAGKPRLHDHSDELFPPAVRTLCRLCRCCTGLRS